MKDAQNIKSGFDRSVPIGRRPALLVIDFQRGFTEPALCPLASECSEAVTATARLVAALPRVGAGDFHHQRL